MIPRTGVQIGPSIRFLPVAQVWSGSAASLPAVMFLHVSPEGVICFPQPPPRLGQNLLQSEEFCSTGLPGLSEVIVLSFHDENRLGCFFKLFGEGRTL